jgi:ABC-type microcin C transport system permease subunit YejE
MTHFKHLLPIVVLLIGIIIGTLSGRYYGQVEVFKQILDDKIECSLTVNPITSKQLK